MNRISRDIVRTLRELWRNTGRPMFTWAGKTYPCVKNTLTTAKLLGLGGEALNADLTLFVVISDLPSPAPAEKKVITISGTKYRIDKINTMPCGDVLSYMCNDASEGVG